MLTRGSSLEGWENGGMLLGGTAHYQNVVHEFVTSSWQKLVISQKQQHLLPQNNDSP